MTQELANLAVFNNIAKYRQEQADSIPNIKMYGIQFPDLVAPNGPMPEPATSVYVHTKIVIVDGIAAMLGSANMCQRSLFTDHEMTVGIVDPVLVRRFMITLVSAWLSVDEILLYLLTNEEINSLLPGICPTAKPPGAWKRPCGKWKGTRIFQFYLGGTSRTYQIFSYFGPIRRELPSNTNVIYVTICSAINYVTERECARSSDN